MSLELSLRAETSRAAEPARRAKSVGPGKLGLVLAYSPLVISTLFAKLSVPPFGRSGIGVTYPLLGGLLLLGLATGRVGINAGRAAFFAILLGVIGATQIFREEPFSLPGLIFLFAVSALYILEIPLPRRSASQLFSFFSNYCLMLAVCGIIQFFAQFAVGTTNAFPIEGYLPSSLLIQGFHYLNPLYYGSSILKANGIFLLEPSFFSQLLAIGLLVELTYAKRYVAIAIYALAMILSYSGTGILVLSAGLPLVLISQRRVDLLFGILGIGAFALLFATPLKLDLFIDRVAEFTNPTSSANARFVSWYFLAQDALGANWLRALFGYGSGTFREVAAEYSSTAAEIFHAKLLIEYGLLGFFSYLGFLLYCIFSTELPVALKVAAVVLTFMAGAYAEPVTGIVLTLLFLAAKSSQSFSSGQQSGSPLLVSGKNVAPGR